ncbi:hypothetical protein G419_25402 [Rhodococcus triatomae BKS 15-14]|nr:hypothetical protein G419_25402 [Rhodococcus triatomae BKS 15-14]
MASAIVGALIGIPFALVGLAFVTANREERVRLDDITKLTNRAWERFKSSVIAATPPAITSHLTTDGADVDEIVKKTLIRLSHYRALAGVPPGTGPYDENIITTPEKIDEQEIRREFDELISELEGAVFKIRGAVDDTTFVSRTWTELRMRWDYLYGEIRTRRITEGLGWIPGELELDLETRLKSSPPLHAVLAALGPVETLIADLKTYTAQPTLDYLLNPIYFLTTADTLNTIKVGPPSMLAVTELGKLRGTVLEADRDESWRSRAKLDD